MGITIQTHTFMKIFIYTNSLTKYILVFTSNTLKENLRCYTKHYYGVCVNAESLPAVTYLSGLLRRHPEESGITKFG